MINTKFNYISGFLLLTCILLSHTDAQEHEMTHSSIDLTRYNNISKSIDSLYNLIERAEQKIGAINKEIDSLENEKIKLNRDCISTNKDIIACSIVFNCDTLSQSLIRIDKIIKDESLKIYTFTQSIEAFQHEINIRKEELQDESNSIILETKMYDGSLNLKFKGTNYHIFVANTDNNEIKMHWLSKDGRRFIRISNLLKYLEKQNKNPLMITNAGMYTPELEPQGLYIEQNELRPLDLKLPKTDANFYLKPNGVYYIDTFGVSHINTTEEFQKAYDAKKTTINYATQSGPMLLIKGKIHSSFKARSLNKKIRSGVGIIDEKRTVFAISLEGENFYDFALLFKDIFGCNDALYLDGAISQMYLKDLAPKELGGQFGPLISVIEK